MILTGMQVYNRELQNIQEKIKKWSFNWIIEKTHESDERDRLKGIFQEVKALAIFPLKFVCNELFHRNFIGFEKFQSFKSNGHVRKIPIEFKSYETSA